MRLAPGPPRSNGNPRVGAPNAASNDVRANTGVTCEPQSPFMAPAGREANVETVETTRFWPSKAKPMKEGQRPLVKQPSQTQAKRGHSRMACWASKAVEGGQAVSSPFGATGVQPDVP